MAYGRIKGITIEIDGNVTKLNNALKSVDTQLSKTKTSLNDVRRLLKMDPKNTELLAQKQKLLSKAITETKERLKTLKSVSKDSLSPEDWDALQREIADTELKLKSLEKEYGNFGTKAGQTLQTIGEKMTGLGNKLAGIGRDLTTYVTLPLVTGGTVAVKKYAEVDKTMTLTNKTMGNTEEQAKKLQKAMEDAASKSTFGMGEAADATLNFARAGLSAEEACNALAPSMNLAAGEGGNLDTVSAGLVATIKGFGDTFDKTTKYADVFAAACNNSALDVDSLSRSMSIAAPVFRASGKTVNDAALYLGVMANNGIDANKAATSLKTGLARLAAPAKQGAEKIEELGLELFNTDGTMKSSIEIQKILHDSFGKLSEQEQLAAALAIFGKNQMAPWLALINTAPEDVDSLSKSLSNCTGTTEEMAEAMMSGFGGSIERLKSALDVLMTKLGQLLAKHLTPIIEKIQKWVDWFMNLDEGTQNLIVKILLFAAALGPVLGIVGKLLTVGGTLIGGIGKIIAAVSGGGGLIASIGSLVASFGPYLLILAGAVAAGVVIYKNWDKLKKGAKLLAKGVGNAVKSMKKAVSDFTKKAGEKLSNGLKAMGQSASSAWAKITDATTTAWNKVTKTVGNAITTARDNLKSNFNHIKTNASNAWTALKNDASQKWTNLKSTVSNGMQNIRDTMSEKFKNVKETARAAWSSMRDTTKKWMSNIATAAGNGIKGAGRAMTTAFSDAKSKMTAAFKTIMEGGQKALGAIGTAATNAFNTVKNKYSSGFGNVISDIKNKFSGIGKSIVTPFQNAWNTIKKFPDALRRLFSGVQIKLPKIKMPHFTVTWKQVGNLFKLPKISVQWYKKAYQDAVMFTRPTVLQTGGGLKGFGDGNGSEVVLGMNKLKELVGASGDTNVVINVTAPSGMNVNQLATEIERRLVNLQKQKAYSMT